MFNLDANFKAKTIKEIENLLHTAEKEFEQAMEREDVYAIGVASGKCSAYKSAILMLESIYKGE